MILRFFPLCSGPGQLINPAWDFTHFVICRIGQKRKMSWQILRMYIRVFFCPVCLLGPVHMLILHYFPPYVLIGSCACVRETRLDSLPCRPTLAHYTISVSQFFSSSTKMSLNCHICIQVRNLKKKINAICITLEFDSNCRFKQKTLCILSEFG